MDDELLGGRAEADRGLAGAVSPRPTIPGPGGTEITGARIAAFWGGPSIEKIVGAVATAGTADTTGPRDTAKDVGTAGTAGTAEVTSAGG